MKLKYKILSCALSCLMLFATACSCNDSADTDNDSVAVGDTNSGVDTDNTLIEGKYFYSHGTSNYCVVYPEDATATEITAVDEMVELFKEATGYELKVVADTDVTVGMKYVSFGDTLQFQQSGLTVDERELGRSGFIVQSVNNNIFVRGGQSETDYGTLYGAYYLLENMVGYKAYAADEIKIEERAYVELYHYNKKILPSIDMRALNYAAVVNDTQYRNRMRLINRFNSSDWAINGHSTLLVLPRDTYYEAHKDWYSNTGATQLCFTNEEMKAEFIKNLKNYVVNNPKAIYISLTMMDDKLFCECDKCSQKVEEYGGWYQGGEAGLYMAFCNDVADAIDEWLTETYPEREMTIVTYAYHRSFTAPARYNSETGTYEATHEDVIPHDNVAVMYCPIGMNYLSTIDSEKNKEMMESFLGWSSICDHMMIYEYGTNFYWYLINFPNYFTMEDNIKFYAEQKVSYFFEQTNGSGGSTTPCFDAFRIYSESTLLWDQTVTYEELVEDFFNQYYKQASEGMKKYFNALRTYQYELGEQESQFGWIYYTMGTADYWPYQTLQSFNGYIDEAFAAIESLKTSDPDMYNKLWHRINQEKLSITYMLCMFHRSRYTAAEYSQMVSELELYGAQYGFIRESESGASFADMINRLK